MRVYVRVDLKEDIPGTGLMVRPRAVASTQGRPAHSTLHDPSVI